jgi:hypothetical protein
MSEVVLRTEALPEALLKLIKTDKVRLIEEKGDFHIIPLRGGSGLLGKGISDNMSTEKFLEYKREEREIEERICNS